VGEGGGEWEVDLTFVGEDSFIANFLASSKLPS
jgi:hypothetical protein